jgi:hypothetical protein
MTLPAAVHESGFGALQPPIGREKPLWGVRSQGYCEQARRRGFSPARGSL